MLKIACPGCQARLTLKDKSRVGKKVACPKCKKAFILKVPKSEAEDDLDLGEGDGAEEEESGEPVVLQRSSSSQSVLLNVRNHSSVNVPLIFGGAAIGTFLLAGLLWMTGAFDASQPASRADAGGSPSNHQRSEEIFR